MVLVGGTAFAQGLMALSLPFLTRLYQPEDFSLLAVYMAITGIIGTVSCLRLNIAISLPEAREDGMALLALSLLAATILSSILFLPVFFAPVATAKLVGQPAMAPLLWMIPTGVWIASVYTALQYWASRQRRFGLISRTRINRAFGGAGTQLGFGVAAPGPFGLLFGHMIYGGLGVFGLFRSLLIHDRAALGTISSAGLLRNMTTYRRFPLWSVPEALFNTAGVQLPIIIIAAVAMGPEAGFMMLAIQVMGLPMALIGASVAQVYLAEAPQKLRDGTLGTFTRQTMLGLLKIGALPLLLVGLMSPFLFGPIFGPEWTKAGMLVTWMTPWFILQFIASPVSMVLHVTEELGVAVLLQAAGFVLRVSAVLAAMMFAPSWIVEAYAISGAIFYGGYLALMVLYTATRETKR